MWRGPAHVNGPKWRFVQFNPLAASSNSRLEDIASTFRAVDAVGLIGTQLRMRDLVVQRRIISGRILVERGWERRPFSNKSCGVSLLLHKRFKDQHVRAIRSGPEALAGRCLAVRVQTAQEDITFLLAYFPPRTSEIAKQSVYRSTVERLLQWIQTELSACPSRSVPVLMLDLNDGMGRTSDNSLIMDDCTVAGAGASEEHYAGAAVRNLLKDHFLEATSARSSIDTYYGPTSSSHVDFVCLPASLGDAVICTGALLRCGRELQLINTAQRRDHVPVLVEVRRPSKLQPLCVESGTPPRVGSKKL
eukprot:488400-Pyramimonas_sp.AAC.1